MRTWIFILSGLLSANLTFAQQKAITENGDEVVLYDDGTWVYQNGEEYKETEIPTNPDKFFKDKDATFLLKSTKLNVGFWLDPKIWSFKKAVNNPDAEYEFELKDGDLYGMVISEKVEIPIESLKTIAFENGRSVAPDFKIIKEEYRTVNGLKVLLLQMNGTYSGVKFFYYGYYYSNPYGTIQFITYSSQSLIDSYMDACEKLLNGLVVTE